VYIRPKRIKGHTYWYLVRGDRHNGKVVQTVIRYLGKNPWHCIKPARFKPPERQEDYPRVLTKMHDRFIDKQGSHANRKDLYSLALSISETWLKRYPSLRTRLTAAQSDHKLQSELGRIAAFIPEREGADLTSSRGYPLAHLAALCLSDPGKALHFRHAAAWLRDALYEEPDIREALSEAHLWHLVDRHSGRKLGPKTFDAPRPLYSGPVDTATKVVLNRYAVIAAGRDGYRLRGKRGAEFLLVRHVERPNELSVRAADGLKPVPILGFRRFSDKDGHLHPVV
jgi:hypothetical protein